MGGATNGFAIVVGYPYKPLQLLPLFLVGAADIFAGKRHRSIGHFCSPYFAKVHRGWFLTANTPIALLSTPARSSGRL